MWTGRINPEERTSMDKEQHSDKAVANFVVGEIKRRVAYLKFIKFKGLPVDEDQLAQFEQEIRDEEKRLVGGSESAKSVPRFRCRSFLRLPFSKSVTPPSAVPVRKAFGSSFK